MGHIVEDSGVSNLQEFLPERNKIREICNGRITGMSIEEGE